MAVVLSRIQPSRLWWLLSGGWAVVQGEGTGLGQNLELCHFPGV